MFSNDGIHWFSGQYLVVQEGGDIWVSEVCTPLGLVAEGHSLFSLFYTAGEKVPGTQPDGNGINLTPGSMGLVEAGSKKPSNGK
jgi:hypothetical protein